MQTNQSTNKKFIKQSAEGKLIVPEAVSECAFHIQTIDNVCSDQFTLSKMKEFIDRLEGSDINKPIKPSEIIAKAKRATNCNSESCVLKSKALEEIIGPSNVQKIIQTRFKPEGPSHSTEWLNNDNIDYVIYQWSKIYPGFLHIPFQMIDFDEQNTRLAQVDLVEEYEKGTRKMGCVINTDKSSGSGIHWFCIFIDMLQGPEKKWSLEYFDSAGDYPKKSVHIWLNNQRSKLAIKYPKQIVEVVDVTRSNQLQKSSTECGVFSLWYILSRLNGVPYTYFSQPNAINDDMMYKFRQFLFRHDKKPASGGKYLKKNN